MLIGSCFGLVIEKMTMRPRFIPLALVTVLALLEGACGPDDKKAGLIVAVQTDMSVPKDVDSVEIEVSTFGKVQFRNTYKVGSDGLRIPATLTLLPPSDSGTPVTIRVISYQRGEARTLRRVVTTVPGDREALLRMPISWLCEGQVTADAVTDEKSSTCDAGSSCLAGSCATDEVDVKDLPDFTATLVFGGASDGKGACFETVNCFSYGVPVHGLDEETCTLPVPEGAEVDQLNFALVTSAGGDGICYEPPEAADDGEPAGSSGPCYVPLDRDETLGWSLDENGDVRLPEAVCDRLGSVQDLALVSTNACASKSTDIPTCGPWSAVSGNSITVQLNDAPPLGMGGEPNATGGAVGSGGADAGIISLYPLDIVPAEGKAFALPFGLSGTLSTSADAESSATLGLLSESSACFSGATVSPSLGSWLNLILNEMDGIAVPYDATAHDVLGFEFATSGSLPASMAFKAIVQGQAQYCAPFTPGGTTRVLFSDMVNCDDLTDPTPLDPSKLVTVRWIVGGMTNTTFDGCIDDMALVVQGSAPSSGGPTSSGGASTSAGGVLISTGGVSGGGGLGAAGAPSGGVSSTGGAVFTGGAGATGAVAGTGGA